MHEFSRRCLASSHPPIKKHDRTEIPRQALCPKGINIWLNRKGFVRRLSGFSQHNIKRAGAAMSGVGIADGGDPVRIG